MKFLHLADLHLGKRLHEYPLLEDQKDILRQAAEAARTHGCEAVLIAGDVYDKPNPSEAAMAAFDDFLTTLHREGREVCMISGNHDGAGKISYLSGLLDRSGIHAPAPFSGTLQRATDPAAPVQVWLMPFLRPLDVRRCYPEEDIRTYEDAIRCVLAHSPLEDGKLHVLVAHQFITGGAVCDSEEFAVGGLDNISAECFDAFDYVALGHLHQAQSCGRETVRYAGSPLKYSLSEEHQRKSFTIVDADPASGRVTYVLQEISLPHEVRTMRGAFTALMEEPRTEDYIHVILTDENVPPDARVILRGNFPRMLKFSVENSKTKYEINVQAQERLEQQSPLELLADFFAFQNNGTPPTDEQLALAASIFEELEEERV